MSISILPTRRGRRATEADKVDEAPSPCWLCSDGGTGPMCRAHSRHVAATARREGRLTHADDLRRHRRWSRRWSNR